MEAHVTAKCPNCDEEIMVNHQSMGKVARCPHCEQRIRIELPKNDVAVSEKSEQGEIPLAWFGLVLLFVCYGVWWIPQFHFAEYAWLRAAGFVLCISGFLLCGADAVRDRNVNASVLGVVMSVVAGGGLAFFYMTGAWPSAAEDADFQNLFKSLIQLCDRLDEVKDATSLKAAKPELDRLFLEIQELDKKVEAIPGGKRKKLYERHAKIVQESLALLCPWA